MLIAVIFFLFISLAIISGLVSPTVREFKSANVNLNSKRAYFLAESGSEDAVYRILKNQTISASETIILDSNLVTTTITSVGSGTKQIDSLGDIKNYQRKLKIVLSTSYGASFNYGAQVGDGGVKMDNNSAVVGNVYSNGQILGANGASISNTAISARSNGKIDNVAVGGNGYAHTISNSTVSGLANVYDLNGSTVSGNVSANSISNCTVSGNAIYNTKTSCSVSGTSTSPNNSVPADPAVQGLPISAGQISTWEQDAAAGGTVGSQTISGTVYLGPKKISGNLTVNGTLILTGTVWVMGSITINNGATIKLSPSYGSQSGVLLAGTANAASATLDQGLILHFAFEDGSGTTATNLSGSGNNGTLVGGPNWVAGKLGTGLSFPAANDYVNVSPGTDYKFSADQDFSVSTWMKLTNNNYWHQVLGNESANNRNGFSFPIGGVPGYQGLPFFTTRNTCCPYAGGTTIVNDGQWHHLTGVRAGDAAYLYVDGWLEGTQASGAAVAFDNAQAFRVGLDPNGYFPFDGTIDEVRIYNRALSSNEVHALFGEGLDTDGFININNGATLMGSGASGSYLLVLSEMNNVNTPAIKVSNNSTGSIVYAGDGVIEVSNNAALQEITAYKIHLNNNATITYNAGLANVNFSAGPSAAWSIDGWQESK